MWKKIYTTCKKWAVGLLLASAAMRPDQDILALLDLLDIPQGNDLVAITQEKWLQRDKERWNYLPLYEDKRNEAMPILKRLGCVDEVKASKNHYDYALLLGAGQHRVQQRLDYLVKEWNRGVRFDVLIFLTGQRFLDKEVESMAECLSTETEMMVELFRNSDIPEEIKKLPLAIIDAPQPKPGKRPATEDTVIYWLGTKPKTGSCLAFSTQPFLLYQDSVLKTHLKEFSVETVAPAAEKDIPLSNYLDSLARFLYQERKRTGANG